METKNVDYLNVTTKCSITQLHHLMNECKYNRVEQFLPTCGDLGESFKALVSVVFAIVPRPHILQFKPLEQESSCHRVTSYTCAEPHVAEHIREKVFDTPLQLVAAALTHCAATTAAEPWVYW